ncbi:MAG: serine/threonine-protein kinase [Vulcanimicrobiota bacterium]
MNLPVAGRGRALLCGLLWMRLALPGPAQPLSEQVTVRVNAYPPCQVFLETSRGESYQGKSGMDLRLTPPAYTDSAGRVVQYAQGFLVLKAPDHGALRVSIPAQDWTAGRLPVEGGEYRLVATSAWVGARDFTGVHPWLSVCLLLGLVTATLAAARWRRDSLRRLQENSQLASQLQSTGDPLLGKNLGRYRVEARIGQGGMGSVYRVVDPAGGAYAAKVLYFDSLDEQQLSRFRREFRVISRFQHPALVRGLDYGEEQGLAYCVMELVQGHTLEEYVRPGGLPWPDVRPWIEKILSGLSHAHHSGIVHRDIKPSNIMVIGDQIKILDFGLARHSKITALTLTGHAMGTPAYMAPEQAEASGSEVDPRSDIYSVGVILFELLTGELPFVSSDPSELIAMHLTKVPPAVSSRVKQVPPELDRLVATMLAKKPGNRFTSVDRILEILPAADAPASPQSPGPVADSQATINVPRKTPSSGS